MCWKLAGSIWHWVFVGFRGNRAFSICQLRKISGRGIETTHDNMVTPTLSHHSLSDVVEKVVGFLLRGLGVGVSCMAIERTAATWTLAVSHCEGGHSTTLPPTVPTLALRGGAGAPWATFHW